MIVGKIGKRRDRGSCGKMCHTVDETHIVCAFLHERESCMYIYGLWKRKVLFHIMVHNLGFRVLRQIIIMIVLRCVRNEKEIF